MSIKEGWTTLSIKAKIGVICMALASVLNLIFVLVFMDALENGLLESLGSSFPGGFEAMIVIYGILFTLLDLLIALFVVLHKNWARRLGLFWGLWGIVNIVLSIKEPSQLFIVYGLYIVSALCFLIARKFKD